MLVAEERSVLLAIRWMLRSELFELDIAMSLSSSQLFTSTTGAKRLDLTLLPYARQLHSSF